MFPWKVFHNLNQCRCSWWECLLSHDFWFRKPHRQKTLIPHDTSIPYDPWDWCIHPHFSYVHLIVFHVVSKVYRSHTSHKSHVFGAHQAPKFPFCVVLCLSRRAKCRWGTWLPSFPDSHKRWCSTQGGLFPHLLEYIETSGSCRRVSSGFKMNVGSCRWDGPVRGLFGNRSHWHQFKCGWTTSFV